MPPPAPLADRLRPQSLEDLIDQQHLIGPAGPIRLALAAGYLPSMILWGPPGTGKTTLARIIGHASGAQFHHLSAVLTGVQELRKLIAVIETDTSGLFAQQHLLFVDEIHRWNKAQQDALLPYVEAGTIILIGATTENPSFEVIGPLLSRCKVYCLEPLSAGGLERIAARALDAVQRRATAEARAAAVATSDGDARRLINTIEIAASLTPVEIAPQHIATAVQKKSLRYDKGGEEHYNLISAFIKSMRGSDPDAAVYYLARMYEAGEDPRFLARRMVIFAAEDIGNADPQALALAVAAFQAYEIVGEAEGWIPLAQAATYLASAPKCNASYAAYKRAQADVETHGTLPTPLHLRNAPTALMKELGYGKDYKYVHSESDAGQEYLPEALRGAQYYCFTKKSG